MKKHIHISYALLSLVLCAQFSLDQDNASVSGKSVKPAVDFMGSITDNSGKTFKAQNITISGLYKQIPVFEKPKDMHDTSYKPSINIIRLDLSEISRIHVPHPESTFIFDSRNYIEIDVFSHDPKKTKNSYLIENSKKILCEEINGAGPIERELQFSALVDLTITTYMQQKKDDKNPEKTLCCSPCKDTKSKKAEPTEKTKKETDLNKKPHVNTQKPHSQKKNKKEKVSTTKKITLRNAEKHLNFLDKKNMA